MDSRFTPRSSHFYCHLCSVNRVNDLLIGVINPSQVWTHWLGTILITTRQDPSMTRSTRIISMAVVERIFEDFASAS